MSRLTKLGLVLQLIKVSIVLFVGNRSQPPYNQIRHSVGVPA